MIKATSPNLIIHIGGPRENIVAVADKYDVDPVVIPDKQGRYLCNYSKTIKRIVSAFEDAMLLDNIAYYRGAKLKFAPGISALLRNADAQMRLDGTLYTRPSWSDVRMVLESLGEAVVYVNHYTDGGAATMSERYEFANLPAVTEYIRKMIYEPSSTAYISADVEDAAEG